MQREKRRLAQQAEEVRAKIDHAVGARTQLEERRIACIQKAEALEKEIDEKHKEAQKLRDASVEMKVRIGALESTVSAGDLASVKAGEEITVREKDAQALEAEIAKIAAEINAYQENADKTAEMIEQFTKEAAGAASEQEKRKGVRSGGKASLRRVSAACGIACAHGGIV